MTDKDGKCMNKGCGLPDNERCINEDMALLQECPNFDPLVFISKKRLKELEQELLRYQTLCDPLVDSRNRDKATITALQERNAEAESMIDGAYEIVEILDVSKSPYNKKWKEDWLRKAVNLFNAKPML